MQITFANLPEKIEEAIFNILSKQDDADWVNRAVLLHEQYTTRDSSHGRITLKSIDDTLAYLALRVPSTYAQTVSVLTDIQEVLPSWQPKTLLDLGSGPGIGSWAAKEIWPSLTESLSIDQHNDFLIIGKQIEKEAELTIDMQWLQQDVREGIDEDETEYDVVLISNVLNELSPAAADKLIGQALNKTKGILIIIEPGTPFGSGIIHNAASKLGKAAMILAPYIENTLFQSDDFYLHFSQRFIRPEFQRRVRQHMRDSSLMASDWEETKYSYTVLSKITPEITPWGRCVGNIQIQKGFLEVPILTKDGVQKIKVMKRYSQQYSTAKSLKWGQLIEKKSDIIFDIIQK